MTADEADELLAEVSLGLALRWGRIGDPALWLLRAVDTAIRRRLLMPLFL